MKQLGIVLLAVVLPMFFSCSQSISAYGYDILSANAINALNSGQQLPSEASRPSDVSGVPSAPGISNMIVSDSLAGLLGASGGANIRPSSDVWIGLISDTDDFFAVKCTVEYESASGAMERFDKQILKSDIQGNIQALLDGSYLVRFSVSIGEADATVGYLKNIVLLKTVGRETMESNALSGSFNIVN